MSYDKNVKRAELFVAVLIGILIGVFVTYMLFWWSAYSFLDTNFISNINIDFNETELMKAGLDYMNQTGQLQ